MPSSFKHTVPTAGMGQETNAQCWYASYKMIYTYLERNTGEIKDKLKGAGLDFDDAMANGLKDTDYNAACHALGLTGYKGSHFNKEPSWYDVGLSDYAETFLAVLKDRPQWVSRKASGNFHIVVAVGYDDSSSKIIFNNPFSDTGHAIEQRLKANLFVRNITGASCSVQG